MLEHPEHPVAQLKQEVPNKYFYVGQDLHSDNELESHDPHVEAHELHYPLYKVLGERQLVQTVALEQVKQFELQL